jgi:hypothetical protein
MLAAAGVDPAAVYGADGSTPSGGDTSPRGAIADTTVTQATLQTTPVVTPSPLGASSNGVFTLRRRGAGGGSHIEGLVSADGAPLQISKPTDVHRNREAVVALLARAVRVAVACASCADAALLQGVDPAALGDDTSGAASSTVQQQAPPVVPRLALGGASSSSDVVSEKVAQILSLQEQTALDRLASPRLTPRSAPSGDDAAPRAPLRILSTSNIAEDVRDVLRLCACE